MEAGGWPFIDLNVKRGARRNLFNSECISCTNTTWTYLLLGFFFPRRSSHFCVYLCERVCASRWRIWRNSRRRWTQAWRSWPRPRSLWTFSARNSSSRRRISRSPTKLQTRSGGFHSTPSFSSIVVLSLFLWPFLFLPLFSVFLLSYIIYYY